MNTELSQKILNNLKDKKPRSKIYFLGINLIFLFSIIFLILILSFLFAFILWDSWYLWQNKVFIANLFLFEFLGLILFFLLIVFWLYRQTDFTFVKYRLWLFLGLSFLILVTGSIIFVLVWKNIQVQKNFQVFQHQVENLPHRQKRKEVLKKLKEKSIFRGRIVKIETQISLENLADQNILNNLKSEELQNYSLVTLKNREETQTFLISKDLLQKVLKNKNLQTFEENKKDTFLNLDSEPQNFRVDFKKREIIDIVN